MRGPFWQGFSILRIHEAAAAATCRQIGVAYWWTIGFDAESMHQAWVRPEFFRASAELAHLTDDDAHTAVGCANDATDVYVLIAVAGEISNRFVIRSQADEGELAAIVGKVGRADVEESGSVGEFYDIENMRRDANVFVGVLDRVFDRQAGPSMVLSGGRSCFRMSWCSLGLGGGDACH